MYLHLGQNIVVPKESIVGIFDLDNSSYSKITRDFLSSAEKNGSLINISEDIPRSFIICNDKGKTQRIYLSQLSSNTLLKRSETKQLF